MSTHPSVEKFKDLFEEELETLYFAESQLLKALPLVKKGVFSKELAHVLVRQTAQTKIYVKSLKSALNHLGRGSPSLGMRRVRRCSLSLPISKALSKG